MFEEPFIQHNVCTTKKKTTTKTEKANKKQILLTKSSCLMNC